MSDAALFAKLAKPVLDLGTYMGSAKAGDLEALLKEAKVRLDTFENEALKEGALDSSTAAARYGLLVILDGNGRNNPNIPLKRWSAGVHGALFEGRDVSLSGLKDLHRKAREAGGAYKEIGTFLQHCIDASEAAQATDKTPRRNLSGTLVLGGIVTLCFALALAVFLYQRSASNKAIASLDTPYKAVISQTANSPEELSLRLDRLYTAVLALKGDQTGSLLGRLPLINPSAKADALYRDALRVTLPRTLSQTLQRSLAQEEDPLRIYDSLRVMAILEEDSPWSSGYLAGWAAQNDDVSKGLASLSSHIARMDPLPKLKTAVDQETLDVAREIASESKPDARAYLELTRMEQILALPDIVLTEQILGLDRILVRRSNTPLSTPIAGLYSQSGWDIARDQIAASIEKATTQSTALLGAQSSPINPTDVLKQLQEDTNIVWRSILDDLRVLPFDDQTSSIRISGALGSPRNPLSDLFAMLWKEVGGTDRTRSHQNQLAIAVSFGPLIQYVEQGKMAEVSKLFSGLNVALAALEPGDEVSSRRLMDVNARARSISALSTAPTFVSQIVEDVLTQAAGATSEALGNPVQLIWERDLLNACRATTSTYPFIDADDASLDAFIGLFAPNSALDVFERTHLGRLLDKSEATWRWTPEALFSGFTRETAAFFQTAYTLREGLFGANKSMDTALVVTSLGQSGPTTLSIGGQKAAISNDTPPIKINWPGDDPSQGMEVAFEGADSLKGAGPWGLFKLLDQLRLRSREDGKRYRVDFKGATARLFVDMEFESTLNPVSLRPLLRDLTCPAKL